MSSSGFIYCFSNPAMPEYVMVGYTLTTVEQSLAWANSFDDAWHPPTPYHVEFAKRVSRVAFKYDNLVSLLDKHIEKVGRCFRTDPEEIREFFNLMDGVTWCRPVEVEDEINDVEDEINDFESEIESSEEDDSEDEDYEEEEDDSEDEDYEEEKDDSEDEDYEEEEEDDSEEDEDDSEEEEEVDLEKESDGDEDDEEESADEDDEEESADEDEEESADEDEEESADEEEIDLELDSEGDEDDDDNIVAAVKILISPRKQNSSLDDAPSAPRKRKVTDDMPLKCSYVNGKETGKRLKCMKVCKYGTEFCIEHSEKTPKTVRRQLFKRARFEDE
jgi:hypothetical protein